MLNRGASHLSGCERPTFRRAALRLPATLLCAFAVQSVATAQHANTVLFGEPNPAGTALPAERTAVHPLTAPYFNEDAFVTSDLRAWYVQHEFGSTLGGSASVAALQVRVALTEDIQFVAYKDGFVDFKDNAIDDSGMNDLAAGIKWAFLQDWEKDMHAAVGIGYELGIGDEEVLQDDDEVRIWASYNNGMDRLHVGANVNLRFATGSEDALGDSDILSWHLHGDYFLNEAFSPVVEVNGYHTLNNGDVVTPFSGVDVANLGGNEDEDVITAAIGGEFRPAQGFGLRLAYESPLTDNVDLFGYRWTVSAVWGF